MSESEYKKVPVDDKPERAGAARGGRGRGCGVRHVQALLLLCSLCAGYMARAHLGVTVVAMTQPRANATEHAPPMFQTYSWPKAHQDMALGSLFFGEGVMMLPMGLISQRWGGKIPVQIGLFVNGVTSVLTPWLTAWGGWRALAACRLVQGLSQAGFYPGIHTMLAQWVPLSERGSLTSYVYTGTTLGTVAAFQVGGLLGASRWGWPSIFWVIGALCLLLFALLTVYGAASPSDHKTVSKDEKDFILGARCHDGLKRNRKLPWGAVLGSRAVWAAVAAHVGTVASFVFFFTQLPTYMSAILKVDIKNNGLLSSLPYAASFFAVVLGGYFSDFFTNRKILSVKSARIMCNSIGSVVPAIATAAVSFTSTVALAVTWFVVAITAQGLCHAGWMVNYMDLAPNFSGGLMAIGTTATNIVIVLLPFVVSSIVTDVSNVYQWRILMYVMAGLILTAHLIFHVFMSADTQSWNEDESQKEEPAANLKEFELVKCETS